MYDVLIVGGGPTGLSAALVLGRCRRRVLVVDSGRPRNAAARAIHGYLSRDGIHPREFLRLGREEIRAYGVEVLDAEVDTARCVSPGEASEPLASFEGGTVGLPEHGTEIRPGPDRAPGKCPGSCYRGAPRPSSRSRGATENLKKKTRNPMAERPRTGGR